PGGRGAGYRGLHPSVRLGDSDAPRGRVHGEDCPAARLDRDGPLRRGEVVVRARIAPRPAAVPGVPRPARPPRGDDLPPAPEVRGMPTERRVCVLSDEKAIRPLPSSGTAMDRIRAVTFDAFGTIVDTGREALLRVSDRIVREQFLDIDAARFLERWDVHFFGIGNDPFLTLAEATEVSLSRTFVEFGAGADAPPYVDMLQAEWLRARAHPEVAGVLEALEGV